MWTMDFEWARLLVCTARIHDRCLLRSASKILIMHFFAPSLLSLRTCPTHLSLYTMLNLAAACLVTSMWRKLCLSKSLYSSLWFNFLTYPTSKLLAFETISSCRYISCETLHIPWQTTCTGHLLCVLVVLFCCLVETDQVRKIRYVVPLHTRV